MAQALLFGETGVEGGLKNHIKIGFGEYVDGKLLKSYDLYYPKNTTVFTSVIGVDPKLIGGEGVTAYNIINTSIGGSVIITIESLQAKSTPIVNSDTNFPFDPLSFINFLLENTGV